MKRLLYTAFLAVVASTSSLMAEQAKLSVELAQPTMKAGDGEKITNHLHIALTGFSLPSAKDRPKANVAIVIDKSGSMQGDKIEQARRAAMAAIERMNAEDIVSVVTYDDNVEVVVPATKVTDPQSIITKIQQIQADGSTALFAGTSKGAAEVRKFLETQRVNRVILLSDGIANVGPSSPAELEELGASLIKEGISVTTMGLGLGYNEDLMTRLALAGNGNHVFIESAETLVNIFQNEFDDVMSVVAKDIRVEIELAEGIRPVKILNSPGEINGQKIELTLGQLYASQKRYFVIEIEVPNRGDNQTANIAQVSATYQNMQTNTVDKLASNLDARFSSDEVLVRNSVNNEILADCVLQIGNEKNRLATELRDQGKIGEAQVMLEANCAYLGDYADRLGDSRLKISSEANDWQSKNLDDTKWAAGRKLMRQRQYQEATNQSYGGASELAK